MTRIVQKLLLSIAILVFATSSLDQDQSARATGPTAKATRCSLDEGKDTCTELDICRCPEGESSCQRTGTCELAFGQRFLVGVVSVKLNARKPDGKCWDAMCGAPDIRVRLAYNGKLLAETAVQKDLFNVMFARPVGATTTIRQGDGLQIEVYDADVASDDLAMSCALDPIDIEHLRSRRLVCSADAGRVEVALLPR